MSIRELQPSSLLLSGRAPRRTIQKSGVQFLGGNSELFSSSYACEKNEEHLCIFDDRAGKKIIFLNFSSKSSKTTVCSKTRQAWNRS